MILQINKELFNKSSELVLTAIKKNLLNDEVNKIYVSSNDMSIFDSLKLKFKNSSKFKIIYNNSTTISVINQIKQVDKYPKILLITNPFFVLNSEIKDFKDWNLKQFTLVNSSFYLFSSETNLIELPNLNNSIGGEKVVIGYGGEILCQNSTGLIKQNNPTTDSVRQKGDISIQINESSEKRKLDVIIISVNYNDYLTVSLENNSKIFDNITVVTSPDDILCQKICSKYKVKCLVTDVMYSNGAIFNKGKAINEAINSLLLPDFILLLDADIVVKEKIEISKIEKNTLYTSDRIIIESYENYCRWQKGESIKTRRESNRGLGFFQLFNYQNRNIDIKNIYSENFESAGMSDLLFRDLFDKTEQIQNTVVHLGPAYKNWKGRKSETFISQDSIEEFLKKKEKFTICSYFFNYREDERQKNNFKKFLSQFKDFYQNMIVGVDNMSTIDFEMPCRVVSIDEKEKKWSKESILNRIMDKIETEYIIWIDGDLIFEELSWLRKIEEVVGDCDFIQLFENIKYLNESGEVHETYKSTVYNIVNERRGTIFDKVAKFENRIDFKPGGAWLGRTEILKKNKFFEKMYVGGGDVIFLYGIFGILDGTTLKRIEKSNKIIYQKSIDWIKKFSDSSYKVDYRPYTINHLFHGEIKSRNYSGRYKLLKNYTEQEEVSIIIPTYKSQEFLTECIKSILSQEENYKKEILIGIDKCEETLEFIKNEKIILENCKIFYFEENNGPYFIRNSLALVSKYDNIVFFDSDDIMLPNLLKETLCKLSIYDCVRWKFLNFFGNLDESKFEVNKWHAHGVFGIKKETFLSLNGFQPWRIGADSEFLMRYEYYKKSVYNTSDIMFFRRQHDNNQTRNQTTGLGSPARLEVQNKLKKMKKEQNFKNPEYLFTKKYKFYEPFQIRLD